MKTHIMKASLWTLGAFFGLAIYAVGSVALACGFMGNGIPNATDARSGAHVGTFIMGAEANVDSCKDSTWQGDSYVAIAVKSKSRAAVLALVGLGYTRTHASVQTALDALKTEDAAKHAAFDAIIKPPHCAAVDGTGKTGDCIVAESVRSSVDISARYGHFVSGALHRATLPAEVKKGISTIVAFDCHADKCGDPTFAADNDAVKDHLGFGVWCKYEKLTTLGSLAKGEHIIRTYSPAAGDHSRWWQCWASSGNPFTLRVTTTRAIK